MFGGGTGSGALCALYAIHFFMFLKFICLYLPLTVDFKVCILLTSFPVMMLHAD